MLIPTLPFLLALSLLPASVFAVNNFAEVNLNPSFAGGNGPVDDTHQGLGPQNASDSTTGGGNATLVGASHVDYAHSHLTGSITGSGSAVFHGYIRDTLTITSPSIPAGTAGSLAYFVTIDGLLHSASGSSDASYTLQTLVNGGAADLTLSATQYSPGLDGGAFVGNPLGTYHTTGSFQFGSPFTLNLQFTASISAANGSSSTGEGDFDISLFWGGISSISSNNTPVTNASLSSSSGTNWLNPSALPGDANLDGKVDLADLSILLNNFGKTTPNWTSGNFDGQPTIDLTDLADVLNNFGQTNPNAFTSSFSLQPSAFSNTPEPTTLSLSFATATLLITRRRVALASRQ